MFAGMVPRGCAALVLQAFHLPDDQIAGMPESFSARRWTVPEKSTGQAARAAREDEQESTALGAGELSGSNAALAELASLLNGSLDRPVIDRTGIEGRFDFRLQWTPDGSDIFGARSEPGLQLKAQKAPVQVLVIDHVEQPSAN
jgi:uncharacterized protein (TIGR03435 family)